MALILSTPPRAWRFLATSSSAVWAAAAAARHRIPTITTRVKRMQIAPLSDLLRRFLCLNVTAESFVQCETTNDRIRFALPGDEFYPMGDIGLCFKATDRKSTRLNSS